MDWQEDARPSYRTMVIRSSPMNAWLDFSQLVREAVFAFVLNHTLAMSKTITGVNRQSCCCIDNRN